MADVEAVVLMFLILLFCLQIRSQLNGNIGRLISFFAYLVLCGCVWLGVIIEDAVRRDTAAPAFLWPGVSCYVSASGVRSFMLAVPLVDRVGSCLILADLGKFCQDLRCF